MLQLTLTVSLDLESMHNRSGLIYGVLFTTSCAQTERIIILIITSGNVSMHLIVSYMTLTIYNLSVFSSHCGHELQSDHHPMHTFYGEHYITKLWAYI